MAIDLTLDQVEQAVKETDRRKNILETNPGDKVRVVKPKTQGDVLLESLRLNPMTFGAAFAIDKANKERKEKGLEPITEDDLKKDETTAGREFQAAIAGASANILEGVSNLLTIALKLLQEISQE